MSVPREVAGDPGSMPSVGGGTAQVLDPDGAAADRWSRVVAGLVFAAGLAVALVGALVVLGWAIQVVIIPSGNAESPAVRLNTGFCFVALGASLASAARMAVFSRIMAGATAIVGALTLYEFLFHDDLGIDQLAFNDHSISVGRMAPNTATGFVLLGLALVSARRRPTVISEASAVAAALIGWLGLIGYAADVPSLLKVGAFLRIASPTAACFALAGMATGIGVSGGHIGALVTTRGPAGRLVRRLSAAAFAVPLLVALVLRAFDAPGALDQGTVILLLVGSMAMTAVVVALRFGRSLEATELARSAEVAERREAERLFRDLLDSAPDATLVVDEVGTMLMVNAQAERLFGYARDELLGQPVEMLIPRRYRKSHPAHRDRFMASSTARLMGEGLELYARTRDAGELPVEVSLSPLRTDRGHLVSAAIRDVTERKRFEGQLQHLADHDSLTGLFNRRRFQEELERGLELARRTGTGGAVLLIDLDHFKYVNDSLGHSAGDELISRVASLLSTRVRASDSLARLGGDEFAVFMPGAGEAEARLVAANLLQLLRTETSVELPGVISRVTASIGIAPFDRALELSPNDLMVEADIAMYDAKEKGRDRIAVFDPSEGRQERMETRLGWSERIREALRQGRLVLYAQPILSLRNEGPPRYELLLRMIDEQGEVIPPGEFLYVAERMDFIDEIDRWVLHEGIGFLGHQQRSGQDIHIELNLSAKSVGIPGLPQIIADELRAAGASPSGLCIEITETAAIVNVERAKQFAKRLGELGCEFALDDFGAGFASFYYLKHLAFDLLKIDGEFIKDLARNRTDQLVVRSLVEIAHGMGKQTIAEFVGDRQVLDVLRDYGVDYAQGFYVGRPRPISDIETSDPPLAGDCAD